MGALENEIGGWSYKIWGLREERENGIGSRLGKFDGAREKESYGEK